MLVRAALSAGDFIFSLSIQCCSTYGFAFSLDIGGGPPSPPFANKLSANILVERTFTHLTLLHLILLKRI